MKCFRCIAAILFMIAALLAPAAHSNAFAQADTLTCDDFTNQDAAQIVLDGDDTYAETLDVDGDGEACPDLPTEEGSDGEEIVLGLGFSQGVFENTYGEPSDDAGADDFAVGYEYTGIDGYAAINIFWLDENAAHIVVTLETELAEDDAYDEAYQFIGSPAELEDEPEELDGGELLYTGHVDIIEEIFTAEGEYAGYLDDYNFGGKLGDIRIILIPGDEDYAVLDIAIGLGEEYATTEVSEEPSGDADKYLSAVRESTDQMLDEIGTFNTLFFGEQEMTEADLDVLVEILTHWSTITEESDAVTAPDGYEDIQSTFEDATTALESVYTVFAAGEDADIIEGVDYFEDARSSLNELDDLLAAAGV